MAWEIQKPGIVNRAETLEREVSYYAVCSTAAGTAAKTVSVDTFFRLETGAKVCVRFSNTNTASTPTLNVNGTGAKQIRYRNASGTSGYLSEYIAANRTYDLVYDGSYWQIVGDVDTILGISDSTSSSSSTTAASSAAVKNLADLISALTSRVADLESQLSGGTWPLMPSSSTVGELVGSASGTAGYTTFSLPSEGTWVYLWASTHTAPVWYTDCWSASPSTAFGVATYPKDILTVRNTYSVSTDDGSETHARIIIVNACWRIA